MLTRSDLCKDQLQPRLSTLPEVLASASLKDALDLASRTFDIGLSLAGLGLSTTVDRTSAIVTSTGVGSKRNFFREGDSGLFQRELSQPVVDRDSVRSHSRGNSQCTLKAMPLAVTPPRVSPLKKEVADRPNEILPSMRVRSKRKLT